MPKARNHSRGSYPVTSGQMTLELGLVAGPCSRPLLVFAGPKPPRSLFLCSLHQLQRQRGPKDGPRLCPRCPQWRHIVLPSRSTTRALGGCRRRSCHGAVRVRCRQPGQVASTTSAAVRSANVTWIRKPWKTGVRGMTAGTIGKHRRHANPKLFREKDPPTPDHFETFGGLLLLLLNEHREPQPACAVQPNAKARRSVSVTGQRRPSSDLRRKPARYEGPRCRTWTGCCRWLCQASLRGVVSQFKCQRRQLVFSRLCEERPSFCRLETSDRP